MILCLIRHGITDMNAQKRLQGWSNTGLSADGHKQTEAVCKLIKSIKWDVIISSDLLRAKQTAEIIGGFFSIPIYFMKNLRERCFGSLEGRLIEEISGGKFDTKETGGEGIDDFNIRIRRAFERIRKGYFDKKVIIVSHGGVLTSFLMMYLGIEKKDWINSEYVLVRYQRDSWDLLK
ncbi:MAG: histidine phosphatase family protein [Deltaproteobacteria bacterium]